MQILKDLESNVLQILKIPQSGYCELEDLRKIAISLKTNTSVRKLSMPANSFFNYCNNEQNPASKYNDNIQLICDAITHNKTLEDIFCSFSVVDYGAEIHRKNAVLLARALRDSNTITSLTL